MESTNRNSKRTAFGAFVILIIIIGVVKFGEFDTVNPDDGDNTCNTDKTGTTAKVVILTEDNFDSIALDPNKDVLVKFYAPWCSPCRRLKPVFEEVANAFADEANVVVAEVDATTERALASKYKVRGYPTVKFFPKGSYKAVDYTSGRSAKAFVDFLNDKAGTRRNVDGSLKWWWVWW